MFLVIKLEVPLTYHVSSHALWQHPNTPFCTHCRATACDLNKGLEIAVTEGDKRFTHRTSSNFGIAKLKIYSRIHFRVLRVKGSKEQRRFAKSEFLSARRFQSILV
jgi:hypothetical protein